MFTSHELKSLLASDLNMSLALDRVPCEVEITKRDQLVIAYPEDYGRFTVEDMVDF